MRYIFILILMVSCVSSGKKVPLPEVEGIDLVLLFEHDGCKVYRFKDGDSRFVYWSDCRGQTAWDEHHQNGRSHHTDHKQTLNN